MLLLDCAAKYAVPFHAHPFSCAYLKRSEQKWSIGRVGGRRDGEWRKERENGSEEREGGGGRGEGGREERGRREGEGDTSNTPNGLYLLLFHMFLHPMGTHSRDNTFFFFFFFFGH
jgi:hypothetical protein